MEVSEDKDLNNAMNGVEVNELNEEILNKNVNEDNVTEIVRKKFYWQYEYVRYNPPPSSAKYT